jgi:hypothetical protein
MLQHSLAILKINPFEESIPFEEVLPDRWHGPHVGLRLADAFLTLRRLPMSEQTMRTCWPEYCHEIGEQNVEMQMGELELNNSKRNRVRILPSAIEITHMEEAISWPMRYLKPLRDLARAVQFAARFGDYGRIVKKRGGTADLWRERNWLGTAKIAEGLNQDRVVVF